MADEKTVAENAVAAVAEDAAHRAANATAAAVEAGKTENDAAARTAVDAAQAVTSLAASAAAATMADAAERERGFYEGVNKWQTEQGMKIATLETESKATREAVTGMASLLSSAMERLSSIPAKASETTETKTETKVEPAKEAASENAEDQKEAAQKRLGRRMI